MEGWLFYSLIALLGFLIWYFIFKKPFWAILILVLLLPFHAFIVTASDYFLNLNGTQANILAFWKEYIVLVFLIKITYHSFAYSKLPFKFKWYDYLIICLFLLSLAINYIQEIPILMTAYGIRYDFLMFAVFMIFRSINLTDEEVLKIIKAFMWSGVVVVVFGLAQKFLSADFLTNFGYAGITDWNPKNPLSLPAHHYIHETNTQRLQSFFSGPNALASYLVILWGLCLLSLARVRIFNTTKKMLSIGFIFYLVYLLGIGTLLFFTHSRSAWIAVIIFSVLFLLSLFQEWRTRILIIVIILCSCVVSVFAYNGSLPENLVRTKSSVSGHILRGAAGVYLIKHNPEGLGVGTAGPSSLRFDTGYTEIQPEAYEEISEYLKLIKIDSNTANYHFVLKNSLVPENWFLQIGVELGLLGLFIFTAIIFGIFWSMYYIYSKTINYFHKELILVCLFIGISLIIHSTFLHTWSDAPTTILYWILVGMVFSTNREVINGKT
ncbi:O-antigen ligase family protein [Patescibacteria group bacterium]